MYIKHLGAFLAHGKQRLVLTVSVSTNPGSAGAISFDYSCHVHSLLTSVVYPHPASMFPFKGMIYSLSRINSEIV